MNYRSWLAVALFQLPDRVTLFYLASQLDVAASLPLKTSMSLCPAESAG